jgi:hypothetical protein
MAAPLKDSFGPDVPGRIARAIVAVHATFPADGGDPAALDVLGFGGSESAVVDEVRLEPSRPRIGESIRITAVVGNAGDRGAAFNVDLRVQLVKSNGARSPKVVKLREVSHSLAMLPGKLWQSRLRWPATVAWSAVDASDRQRLPKGSTEET